ncbi:DUF484 family protein [Aquilutibacter rugosus]|uniref:DUF484 family protein n=1 Tax=Aquilutibacter rugosus TaxID=3115820 RepID=UPI002F417FDE
MSDVQELAGHEVAAWIRQHPEFLQQYPDLVQSIVIPRSTGTTSSLASYQLEILREKNRDLSRRLQELYGVAQQNEQLTRFMHRLTLALVRADSAADVWRTLAASLTEDFNASVVRTISFEAVAGLEQEPWHRHIARDSAALASFRDLIAGGDPICGRLNPDKQELLYGPELASQVQSSALLSLGSAGLLAIGSHDANRFYPGMGTLFLDLLAEAIPVILSRHDT